MDMIVIFFLIYALIFRLAVIATGIVAIVLGYRLFAYDLKGGGDVNAQAGPIKLTLKSAGSGAAFALFGAFIIVVMLSQGNPEFIMKNISQLRDFPAEQQEIGQLQLKGNNNNEQSEAQRRFEQAFKEGHQMERFGDAEKAIEIYGKALSESEVPLREAVVVLNALAWIYREQQRTDEALALARVATKVDGSNPAYLDTLALILLDRGEHKAAEQAAETAVRLDPTNQDHQETLQTIRKAPKNGQ